MMTHYGPAWTRRVFTDEEITRIREAEIGVRGSLYADMWEYDPYELAEELVHAAMDYDPQFRDAVVTANRAFHAAVREHEEGSPEREAVLDGYGAMESELVRFQSRVPIAAWVLGVASLLHAGMDKIDQEGEATS